MLSVDDQCVPKALFIQDNQLIVSTYTYFYLQNGSICLVTCYAAKRHINISVVIGHNGGNSTYASGN